MKITFLGTGTSQGVPVIGCNCDTCKSDDPRDKRLRSSILVRQDGITLVVDTGPDFRQQMLRAGVSRLDAVLFTHEHRDHIAGLDDIRTFNFIQQSSMDIFAEERVLRALDRGFPYVFAEKKYPGVPRVRIHVISTEPFMVGPLDVVPVRVMHYRLPVLGFRFGDFAYLTDASNISMNEKKKLDGAKYLVVNALRRKKHISHFTLSQALELIRSVNPEKGYLTHVSHQLGPVARFEKELPDNVSAAYDGLVLEL
ncbi:MAG: MBL fold metallo-hydrolase [Bacteroidales bacterium]